MGRASDVVERERYSFGQEVDEHYLAVARVSSPTLAIAIRIPAPHHPPASGSRVGHSKEAKPRNTDHPMLEVDSFW